MYYSNTQNHNSNKTDLLNGLLMIRQLKRQHQSTKSKNHYEIIRNTGKHKANVQVCENNWIRIIVGVRRADDRRMNELGVTFGVKDRFKKKLVRNRLKWTGHVKRMGDEISAESGFKRRRGRPSGMANLIPDDNKRRATFVILSLLYISGGLYGRNNEVSRRGSVHLYRW